MPCWSSTNSQRRVMGACGQRSTVFDHVGAVGPAHPSRAHDGRRGARMAGPPRSPHPACCARRPTGGRRVPLDVRTIGDRRRTHSRSRCRRRWAPASGRGLGHVAGAQRVDGEGRVGVGLAGVDRCVCTRRGARGRERIRRRPRATAFAVGDVEGVDVGGQHLEPPRARLAAARRRPALADVGSRRAGTSPARTSQTSRPSWPFAPVTRTRSGRSPGGAPAGRADQAPSTTGARSRSGSHQLRWSAYQPTVSARPSAKGTVGSQPSSLRILDESSR